MIGSHKLIAILGLSKGGTNHFAQCIHACDGVVGLTEGVSRMVRPTRRESDQILRPSAIQSGVLKPKKAVESARALCVNKVNYTLVAYPEAWVGFLASESNSIVVTLLRNPFMVHQSRARFVREHKPQRTRWLDPAQLARELLEMLAMTWRLPKAKIVFHERGSANRHAEAIAELGLESTGPFAPESCHDCGATLSRRPREAKSSDAWLWCPHCKRFIEGEGNYNFLRHETDVDAYRRQETDALDDRFGTAMGDTLGSAIVEFFASGCHWHDDAERAFRNTLDREADRWKRVPLNEILYPY